MIDPKTPVVELSSRLGRVGSIQAWDPWESRKSERHAKWWVSKIARLSHGLGEAEDFEAHFDRVVHKMHHVSVLEFVPFLGVKVDGPLDTREHLPAQSARGFDVEFLDPSMRHAEAMGVPASAFLVEAPIFVARQWMRHRSFAYLEMSRRYVKGSRVPLEFYGDDTYRRHLHDLAVDTYERLIATGEPPELARSVLPVGLTTKFWVAGFDRDWRGFLALRNEPHAQPEIRAFASWISDYLDTKETQIV